MLNAELSKLLVIVGCAKSGTTALARHLSKHPRICLGKRKEPMFFTNFGDKDWTGPATDGLKKSVIRDKGDYIANFEDLRDGQWAVDASTDYIWCKETTDLLAAFAKGRNVRVICIVRDPLERAVSEYNHTLRHGWERLSFNDAIDAEKSRYDAGWHPLFYHMRRSTVCQDLRRFADAFQDRFLTIDYHELRNAQNVTNRICAFLDIPEMTLPEMTKENVSFIPRNFVARALLNTTLLGKVSGALLPRTVRSMIWENLHTNARSVPTVKNFEILRFRELLSEEIERCLADPLVPTENWSCVERNLAS